MSSSATVRRGILLMIAGSSVFATNDALSKLALTHIPTSEILAVRGTIAALLLALIMGWKRELPTLRYALDLKVLARGSAEACVAVMFITSITVMSIADSTAILQVAPLVTMAGAVFLFGSHIGWRQWAAVGVGLLGVMLIVKPGGSAFHVMALLPLGAAVVLAARDFVTVSIGTHVPTRVITFTTAVIGTLIGFAGSAVETWRPLDPITLAYLIGGSLTLVCGHILTIAAFRGNDPAVIAPFRYAAVVCSVAYSASLFNAMPDLVSIGGMALIMAAGLYTMHDNRKAAAAAEVAAHAKGRPV